jgi:hypothetical protein
MAQSYRCTDQLILEIDRADLLGTEPSSTYNFIGGRATVIPAIVMEPVPIYFDFGCYDLIRNGGP